MNLAEFIVAAATAVFVTTTLVLIHRPKARLRHRVDQYTAAALSRLGRSVPTIPVRDRPSRQPWHSRLALLWKGENPKLYQRLVHSGRYGTDGDPLIGELRVRQIGAALLFGSSAGIVATVFAASPMWVLVLTAAGGVSGAFRPVARIDRDVDQRCRRLRAEIPAVCQLLAVRLRGNSSITNAVSETLSGITGDLANELQEVLTQHRAGRPLDQALYTAATTTPEPEAARVHRLLANSIRNGSDAAPELLRLARGVRSSRVLALRRNATNRRGAVLLPTIGLLAPQMMIFIAAPLPGMVLGQ